MWALPKGCCTTTISSVKTNNIQLDVVYREVEMSQVRGKKATCAAIVLFTAMPVLSAGHDRPPLSGERPAKRARTAAEFFPEAQRLVRAVERGKIEDVAFVRSMIARYGPGEWINVQGIRGQDPESESLLHIAAGAGSREIVQLLLDHGAGVNAVNGRRSTPLHEAVNGEHREVISLLIDRGADVLAEGRDQMSPFLLALSIVQLMPYDTATQMLEQFIRAGSLVVPASEMDAPLYILIDDLLEGEIGTLGTIDSLDEGCWENIRKIARFLVSHGVFVSGETLQALLDNPHYGLEYARRICPLFGELFQLREARMEIVAQGLNSALSRDDDETRRVTAAIVSLIASLEGSYKATWEISGVGASA